MHALILLKFSTHIGDLKANARVNSWVNLINIKEVISDFKHKAKSKFYLVYKVNRFEEQAENRYVARLNIIGVPFGG